MLEQSTDSKRTSNGTGETARRIGIAVVEQAGRVLVGIRPPTAVLAGFHEFPGGKCHAEESSAECAIRECFEETGLRVEIVELLQFQRHTYPHGTLELNFFLCQPVAGQTAAMNGFQWIEIPELRRLNFPAGNAAAVEKLLDRSQQSRPAADLA